MRWAFAILLMMSSALGAQGTLGVAVSHGAFTSDRAAIPYDLYRPDTDTPVGGVLLLHGADGMTSRRWLDSYQRLAQGLASAGFVVLLPHYFSRTGTGWADRPTIVQNFLPWAETAADAITFLGTQPGVNPKRVGVVGVSLGGSLANSLATQDARIAAVVDCFGTLPEFVAEHASRFAPTLILHGEDDPVVPVSEATQLESALKSHHVPYEIKLYPGQGHGFTGAALVDAEHRTIDFLMRYLSAGGKA